MRILYLIILVLFYNIIPLESQNIVNPEHIWNIGDCAQSSPACWTTRYQFNEDSILIKGKYYHELLQSNEKTGNSWIKSKRYMREVNNRIWYIDDIYFESEILLYDFNLNVNDTMVTNNIGNKVHLVVENVDTIQLSDSIHRKRITVYSINEERHKIQWVEGIGDMDRWLSTVWVDVIDGGDGWLLCYHSNDSLIYQVKRHHDCWLFRTKTNDYNDEIILTISPNPSNDFIQLETNLKIQEINIFDQIGNNYKLINTTNNINISNLLPGVYILRIKTTTGNYYYKKIIKL